MPQTLFEKLKAAETLNADVGRIVEQATKDLSAFQFVPGFEPPAIARPREYDVADVQRLLLDAYRSNPVLARALSGEETVEESAYRLGARRSSSQLLPYRRNTAHNEQVALLAELVPHCDNLERKGLQFHSVAEVGGAIGGGIGSLMFLAGLGDAVGASSAGEAVAAAAPVGGLCALVFGGYAGLVNWTMRSQYRCGILDDARFLDQKIHELL